MTDTPLGQLLAIREELAGKQKLTLRVQRWDDPQILITYKLLDQKAYADSTKAYKSVDQNKIEEVARAVVDSATDRLVRCCTGIELKGKVAHTFVGFDQELAEALGLGEDATARQVCQKLFIADGDLNAHADRLAEWSGYNARSIDEEFSGE